MATLWCVVFSLAVVSALIPGCSYDRKSETYSQAAITTPHYSSINANIIQRKCLPCHTQSGGAPDFTTYNGVLRRIKIGAPETSSFYTEIESGSMPEERPMLSDDEILAVYQWIQNGAAND